MSGGSIVLVLGAIGGGIAALAGIATVLAWLGFTPNGPRLLTGLKARLTARRKEREELKQRLELALQMVQELVDTNKNALKLYDGVKDDVRAVQQMVAQLQQDVGVLRLVLKGAASQEEVAAMGGRLAHVEEALRIQQAALGEFTADMDLPAANTAADKAAAERWQRLADFVVNHQPIRPPRHGRGAMIAASMEAEEVERNGPTTFKTR